MKPLIGKFQWGKPANNIHLSPWPVKDTTTNEDAGRRQSIWIYNIKIQELKNKILDNLQNGILLTPNFHLSNTKFNKTTEHTIDDDVL